jgi:DNA excision repair protein ERCC-2
LKKWEEQDVLKNIMDYKLLFVEEQDPKRLSRIITNYKKACDTGRGGMFFLSMRNKAAYLDSFKNHQARCIIFIGYPTETKLSQIFYMKLENYQKNFGVEKEEFFIYDAFKLFSAKISDKILDCTDKKVLVVLDEKLMSDRLKGYLPEWLHKIIHIDFDKENVNTDERLKNINNFLSVCKQSGGGL